MWGVIVAVCKKADSGLCCHTTSSDSGSGPVLLVHLCWMVANQRSLQYKPDSESKLLLAELFHFAVAREAISKHCFLCQCQPRSWHHHRASCPIPGAAEDCQSSKCCAQQAREDCLMW